MSQGTDQLDTSPSENADHGADALSIDDIAGDAFEDDEAGEEDSDEIEADEADIEDEEDETDDKPTAKRKLKVGDEDLDEEEVVSGYLRQRDYTRKTEEVAAQRREVEAVRQQIAAEREHRANSLDVLIGELHQELLGVDPAQLNQLLDTDPKAYLRAKEHLQAKQSRIQQAIQQRFALHEQAKQEQARELAEYAREQEKLLPDKIPQWRDAKRRESDSREIAQTLRAAGYTDAEINELYDARAVVIARKAALYDKLQATRGQKAPQKPQSAPLRPGASVPTNQKAVVQKRAVERLRSNPNSLDALAGLVSASG
ncbi:MAG: hypothetical protein LW835_13085 [Burkholderiaceae bacterium]|jgi:hypothetical protein|uniref:hypothetical protein n=1 Tax=Silanimonas sp. TaxID=1929290 RepID=UPI0022BD4981|nr:hypothetical protein [Silanimonas sp.]MCE2646118.1 hypothetical protein [Burkholderiaceae bacterium]MCZ8113817.1 hypothetical protein [Silanimonas sp.]